MPTVLFDYFFADFFVAAFLAGAFLVTGFVTFLAAVFFGAAALVVGFLVTFFAAGFLVTDFLATVFFLAAGATLETVLGAAFFVVIFLVVVALEVGLVGLVGLVTLASTGAILPFLANFTGPEGPFGWRKSPVSTPFLKAVLNKESKLAALIL